MSYSEIYGIKKDTTGTSLKKFKNSWLFIPMIWDLLADKYLENRKIICYDFETGAPIKENIIHNKSLYIKLDKILMEDNIDINDRIVWELGCQNIFLTKDKNVVSNAIRTILERDGNKLEVHIKERFNEMADFIESIDENKYPYFVHKNSSCDDSVENWFSEYIKEEDIWRSTGKIINSNNVNDTYIIQFVNQLINYVKCIEYFNGIL